MALRSSLLSMLALTQHSAAAGSSSFLSLPLSPAAASSDSDSVVSVPLIGSSSTSLGLWTQQLRDLERAARASNRPQIADQALRHADDTPQFALVRVSLLILLAFVFLVVFYVDCCCAFDLNWFWLSVLLS